MTKTNIISTNLVFIDNFFFAGGAEIEQEGGVMVETVEETEEEQIYAKFNPPKP